MLNSKDREISNYVRECLEFNWSHTANRREVALDFEAWQRVRPEMKTKAPKVADVWSYLRRQEACRCQFELGTTFRGFRVRGE